ncbi:MAG TPA: dienelactone hydrolase family protein [Terracidiphilus sp.]|nr:dienelactone hydrolase family protein [Terracidiphilus sp.]
MISFRCIFPVLAAAAAIAVSNAVFAQQEFPPPQGKGPVVVVASGLSGPSHYAKVARDIAALGYDAVLFDGSAMEHTHGEAVHAAILQAQQMPHALPGKVALVGFSAGGGESLYYATEWPDLVTGVIVWFPATSFIRNVSGFIDRLQVPVLMFAGEKDHYRDNCCTADTARNLAAAARAAGKPFDLYTYPKAEHDFVRDGAHFNADADADAFQKTADRLKQLSPVQ